MARWRGGEAPPRGAGMGKPVARDGVPASFSWWGRWRAIGITVSCSRPSTRRRSSTIPILLLSWQRVSALGGELALHREGAKLSLSLPGRVGSCRRVRPRGEGRTRGDCRIGPSERIPSHEIGRRNLLPTSPVSPSTRSQPSRMSLSVSRSRSLSGSLPLHSVVATMCLPPGHSVSATNRHSVEATPCLDSILISHSSSKGRGPSASSPATLMGVPHCMQNLALSGSSVPHFGQFTFYPPGIGRLPRAAD